MKGDSFMSGAMILLVISLACLASSTVQALDAYAYFAQPDSISGVIQFSQTTQASPVSITVTLANINTSASVALYIYSVPIDVSDVTNTPLCASAGQTIFNPTNATAGNSNCSPASGSKFSDCRLGDLAGKFGLFTTATISSTFSDTAISLFGSSSILGRAVVLQSSTGARLACANINYAATVRTLRATFTGAISGTITFKQLDASSPTLVLTDLYRTDANTTVNHNWHVHVTSIATPGDCTSTGGHYNPLNAPASDVAYPTICKPSTPENCEIGDLSSKFARLNLSPTRARNYYVDTTSLSLFGTYPIANRSVVIHAENAGSTRVACADLIEVVPITATALFTATLSGNANSSLGGNITFTQSTPAEPVVVRVNLPNLGAGAAGVSWQLNQAGIDVGCSPLSVGELYNPLNVTAGALACNSSDAGRFGACRMGDLAGRLGMLATGASVQLVDPALTLFGRFSLVGRSVTIATSPKSCATIELDSAASGLNVYVAKFSGTPVLGQITFAQPANNPNAGTVVYVNVWRSDGLNTYDHNWHVHVNPVNGTDCSSTLGHFNPLAVNVTQPAYSATCTPSTPLGCELGDLAGKHSKLSLLMYRRLFLLHETDVNLPLSGPNSIAGRSVVIHDANSGSTRISCATIVRKPDLQARAVFTGLNGVSGIIQFSQASINSPTVMSVDLSGIDASLNNTLLYHVHEYEVASPGDCSAGSTGGHFDPFLVDKSSYASVCNSGSSSRFASCEIGDLSGKFGPLNLSPFSVSDSSLSLHGRYSIIGRSIVIHFANGTRWLCATIYPTSNMDTRVVRAKFTGQVEGSIILRQMEDQPDSPTSVYFRLKRPSADTPAFHNWHVHVAYVDGEGATCDDALGHYNPYGVNTTSGYGACSSDNPYACELGDLSSRFGKVRLSNATTPGFFVDYFLPLSGPVSIEGRSIVIHDANNPLTRIACATLSIVTPRRVVANFDGTSTNGVTGTVTFTQQSINEPTFVSVALAGLYQTPAPLPFHVHSFPLDTSVALASRCAAVSAGGHYSPLPTNTSAPYPVECAPTSSKRYTSCEVGDLSGKLGKLNGGAFGGWDFNLPLFGRFSVAGRSLVIHRATGEVWSCATLSYPNEAAVTVYVANFTSSSSLFTGSITFTQPVNSSDAETTVFIKLAYVASNASSSAHNFHVHVNRVVGDSAADASVCSTALGHYNPLNVSTDSATYSANCSPSKVTGCELGDLSSKHSTISFVAGVTTRALYTDTWLPLFGNYSIFNRSIVIHAENRGSARVACTNLQALSSNSGGTNTPTDSGSGSDTGAIVGGVIGGLVGLVVLVALLAVLSRRSPNKFSNANSIERLNEEDSNDHGFAMNPAREGIPMSSMSSQA